jgi:hypothetical protein
MHKMMPVIPVIRVVDKKRIMGKNGGPMRRRGTYKGLLSPPPKKMFTKKYAP